MLPGDPYRDRSLRWTLTPLCEDACAPTRKHDRHTASSSDGMAEVRPVERMHEPRGNQPVGHAPKAEVQPTFDPKRFGHGVLSVGLLVALQRSAGNVAVAGLVEQRRGAPVSAAAPTKANIRRPVARRLRYAKSVQRQGPQQPADPSAKPAGLSMGPITAITYTDLLSANRFFTSQLKTDAAEVPGGEPSRTAAEDLVKQADAWVPFLRGKGTEALDEVAVNQARVWYQAFVAARKDLESYKIAKARADLERVDAYADETRTAVDAIPDQLADYQRVAFLNKKDEVLEHLASTLGKALQVSSALLEIHETCMELVGWLSNETTHVDELIEKLGPIAEGAHKLVAAFEGLSSALTILRGGEGATEMDKEMSKASAGLGLTGAAGSLTGVGAAYMVYFGAILSVGQAALKIVGAINREHAHEFNRLMIAQGDLGSVDWSAEPGGREAFEFMGLVMHADSSADIPTHVPEAVDELMVDSEEEFKKGTGEEVPTKGFWFWKHTNPDKIRYWLMKNRNSVWAMLYGSVTPPT